MFPCRLWCFQVKNISNITLTNLRGWFYYSGVITSENYIKGGKKSKKKKSHKDGGHAGEHHATKVMKARKSEHEHRRLAKAAFPMYRPDRDETPVPENQNPEARPGG